MRAGSRATSATLRPRRRDTDVESRLLVASVGVAVEEELVRRRLESVDRRLGEERVSHLADPLDRLPIGGDDCRGAAVPLDDELVDVCCVERIEGLQSEVVE